MIRFCLLLLAALSLSACAPQSEGPYRTRDASDGGTGKFFMGREIAPVLEDDHEQSGVDRPSRDVRELPERLINALRLGPADRVADIGAGSGYYTWRLATRVPHGRVYAVDLQQVLLDSIAVVARRDGFRNVVPVMGAVDTPNLEEESVDLALIVVSYHEFSHPFEMLTALLQALRPGGRLVIVEYRAEDETIPVPSIHRMSEEQVRQEAELVGFEWIENLDVLPQQHVLVMRKPLG
ncbi:MAG: methyltransferase domain-containing protein [Rhodothermales bacterium]|nr:methyltransferase domain-containing protein [Rhodothermales bacterium]